MLGRLFRRNEPSDPRLDSLRNQAINAWIHTWPEDKRLETFLAGIDPTLRREVGRSARDLLKTARRLFHGGRYSEAGWEQALRRDLHDRFAWISDESFSTLVNHLQWESK